MLYNKTMEKNNVELFTLAEGDDKESFGGMEEVSNSFKVYWSDEIITDPRLINYYKICLREISDENKLIGRFDNFGGYLIDIDLRRELARMQKGVNREEEDFITAEAEYMDKVFFFLVEITTSDDGKAMADLYIKEKVARHHEIEFKTFVAAFIDENDASFITKMKRAFHIIDGLPVLQDTDIPNLAILLQGQLDNGIFLDELIELGSQIFVLRALEELSSCGDVGKAIIDEYNEKMREDKPLPERKQTEMRKILDEIVEKNGGYEALPMEGEKLDKLFDNFNSPVQKVEDMRKSYRQAGKWTDPTAKPQAKTTEAKKASAPKSSAASVKKKGDSNKPKGNKPEKPKTKKDKAKKDDDKGKKAKQLFSVEKEKKTEEQPKVNKLNKKSDVKEQNAKEQVKDNTQAAGQNKDIKNSRHSGRGNLNQNQGIRVRTSLLSADENESEYIDESQIVSESGVRENKSKIVSERETGENESKRIVSKRVIITQSESDW